ncbi:efflux RND transporter periplasmic adaptor subunit [Halomonas binhaiensis]|uniref:Efflux RND transporter periplasmic adaptor subunit n=1 Tax=Halomonas binhaiensis TaxID=2562282 RepID=A0A5C1NBV9_9GAMM|nr:efflux RND transporter periplasmic adaptor subunit [Halomonas binhaiensis]QEM81182.1 efflux RND transporter periplasmic adaptor subunit [Halomonas binhaiensis]
MNKSVAQAGVMIAIVAIVIVVVVFLSGQPDASAENAWPATKVALAEVKRRTPPRAFFGIGELEAIRQVQVAAETSGRVSQLEFDSGQKVERGQVLVQLNDAPERAERVRLQAQLRNAQALLQRLNSLAAQSATTPEQRDNAEAQRDMARGELQQVEARLEQKAIRAPFSGTVGIRRVHLGQYLSAGDTIASLVDADQMHANFALDEEAIPQLRPGQPVELEVDAYPGRTFLGVISAVDPLVDAARMAQVQATLANEDGELHAGMYASIRVPRLDDAEVLSVPETAVTYTAYGETVFIVEPGQRQSLSVKRVAIETGERWQGYVAIDKGLDEGDRVVTSGQLKLSDGMVVEPLEHDTLQASRDVATLESSSTREEAQ